MPLTAGTKAIDFTLVDTTKTPRTLSEFLGRKIVLAFFPGAFTGVCTKEMCALRDSMAEFNGMDAQVVGISVDSPLSNKAFAEQHDLGFPLLSDFTRYVSNQYCGLVHDFSGIAGYSAAKRAVFVLDRTGLITYSWISEHPGQEPDYNTVRKAVSSI